MKIERFEGNGRMSKVVAAGDTLYLCGQTDRQSETIEEQTKTVLERIENILNTYGSDKEHLLMVQIYLKNMSDFAAMNAVYDEWVVKGCEPARACVEAPLAAPNILVEIVVTAAKK